MALSWFYHIYRIFWFWLSLYGWTDLDHRDSDTGSKDDGDAVEEEDAGDGGHQDKPEPEEDIDLLVNNVQWQHAEAVVSLGGAAWSILVKTAFGDLKQK